MTSPHKFLAALLPMLLCCACDLGMDPPAATRLIKVIGGSFTLGPPTKAQATPGHPRLECGKITDKEEANRCDSGKVAVDKSSQCKHSSWINDLTWVPNAKATVSDFQIEEHEVTNTQYAYCVEMEACTEPGYNTFTWDKEETFYYGNDEYLHHPVVNVTWEQARTYCRFIGRDLPTEAQWERAARLGPPAKKNLSGAYEEPVDNEGYQWRTFPWRWNPWKENTPNWATCNPVSAPYAISKRCQAIKPMKVGYSGSDHTELLGIKDLASNVSEWVLDGFKKYAYCTDKFQGYGKTCQCQGDDECARCLSDGAACAKTCVKEELVICKAGTWSYQPTGEDGYHVVRGGSFRHNRCWHRLFTRRRGKGANSLVGFRCAK